ncbi:hypothetical protein LSCM1_00849 [Leishmania martiniquensis]|uniref:Uncharacterized protein n=1 Tax=Leishmania martiniquensis TaxID=1580590 RepID=A0A836G5F3_9TRYP|nr:hypothetical protein LSCM1_00849 [Leishmania martiniquensis]
MLTWSCPRLRRRGTGHVVKYLEGVPTPTKLIDHLAGADLHASAELPFFTTVPRYVDAQREQRLSRLFFHHVLYPAGGSRLPYQAVVVRGGRAVRAAVAHILRVKEKPSGMLHRREQQRQQRAAVGPPALHRPSPLAVPSSQLGSSKPTPSPPGAAKMPFMNASTAVPAEYISAAASWARVDPARRPFFFARTSRGHEHRHNSQRLPEDTKRSVRTVEDTMLAPLRGVVEHFWNESKHYKNSSCQDTTDGLPSTSLAASDDMAERVRQLLVSPAAGLLWMPASVPSAVDACEGAGDTSNSVPDSPGKRCWAELMAHVRKRATATMMHGGASGGSDVEYAGAVRTSVYVQTRLPPSATVALPLAHVRNDSHGSRQVAGDLSLHEDASEEVICRIAGGVEPVVPFAVGRPFAPVEAKGAAASLSDRIFAHVTCLTQLSVRVSSAPPAKAPAVGAASDVPGATAKSQAANVPAGTHSSKETAPHSHRSSLDSAEPWRLGGVGLDLMIPLRARTVAEHHPTKPSAHSHERVATPAESGTSPVNVNANAGVAEAGRYVVGRTDAETYLLPQRELLLTLHVPVHTEDMCAAQNQERLRRQVRAGHASSAALSAAWPTEQARLTSSRRAAGQYANALSANETGVCQAKAVPQTATTLLAASPSTPLLLSRTSYEVRALPGDVVYIPRGWGFDVQRILGTATIHSGSCGGAGGPVAGKVDFCDNRTIAPHKGARPGRPLPGQPESREPMDPKSDVASTASVELTSVEVDAVCLNYHPYPELTEAQAAVYVAANYVHGGVDEFYEHGGNRVYHAYH